MNYKGINYDIGTKTVIGGNTRETLDWDQVARELAIIRNELHCNAVRISGLDIDRITRAAGLALRQGLTVLFSPALHYDTRENTLPYLCRAAGEAEKLRQSFPNIILVAGCELSLFTQDIIKGDTPEQRLKQLFSPFSMLKNMLGIRRTYNRRLNTFLQQVVHETRQKFKGKITYASGLWEKVDWSLFDLIGIDHYRASYNKPVYTKQLQSYFQFSKPVLVTEFGCCTFKGAEDKGGMGWAIVDWKKNPPELKGDYPRSEETQAQCLTDLLTLLDQEKVTGAFVFTFISNNYVYSSIPRFDLDRGAYGVVKVTGDTDDGYQGLPWLPKQSFYAVADYYRSAFFPHSSELISH